MWTQSVFYQKHLTLDGSAQTQQESKMEQEVKVVIESARKRQTM